jgi:MFS family permease
MTSSTALIGDYLNEKARHKFMSIQGMAIAMGGILFITVGGLLAQLHWSYPFAIYILPLFFLPLLVTSLYEPEKHIHIETEIEIESKLWPIYLTAFCAMVLFYMLPTQLPYLIIETLHGQPSTIGLVIATAMLFNALTAKQYAKLKGRFSYKQIYIITFIFFGIGLFIISQASSITQLFYSTAFIGIGFGLILVNTNSWFLSQVPAHKRGKASGILASSFFLGQFSSPLILEPIVKIYEIQGLFFIVSCIAIMISLILFLNMKIARKKKYGRGKTDRLP